MTHPHTEALKTIEDSLTLYETPEDAIASARLIAKEALALTVPPQGEEAKPVANNLYTEDEIRRRLQSYDDYTTEEVEYFIKHLRPVTDNLPDREAKPIYECVKASEEMPKTIGRYHALRLGEPTVVMALECGPGMAMAFCHPSSPGQQWKGWKEFSWLRSASATGYTEQQVRDAMDMRNHPDHWHKNNDEIIATLTPKK